MKSVLKYGSIALIALLLFTKEAELVKENEIIVEKSSKRDTLVQKEKGNVPSIQVSDKNIKEYNFDCLPSKEKKSFISPKPEWDIESDKYIVNNDRDTLIRHHTGSDIHIPKNSFQNKNGQEVNGYVTVHYREFHNSKEVALSGIPMNLGDTAQLVSGGMFELRVKKHGVDLEVRDDKAISVDLMSSQKDPEFDHYYLNEENLAWENKGDLNFDTKDASREIAKNIRWWEFTTSFNEKTGFFANFASEVVLAVRESEQKKFKRWNKRRKGDSKGVFYTIFSKRRFPGEQAYKYLSWKITDDNSSEDVDQFMTLHNEKKGGSHSVWNDITFSHCSNNQFYVHFSKGEKHLVLKVKPDVKRYPGENKFIRKQLKLENRLVLKSEQIVRGLFAEAVPAIKSELIGKSDFEVQKFMINYAIYKNEIEEIVLRKLYRLPSAKLPYRAQIKATRLGVHNIDSPINIPSALVAGIKKAPKLGVQYFKNSLSKREQKKYEKNLVKGYPIIDDEKRDLSTVAKIIVINEGVNTLNEFKGKEMKQKFQFLKKEKCVGLVFMIDGSVRIIQPKQFKKQKRNSPQLNFNTELCEGKDELDALLADSGFSL